MKSGWKSYLKLRHLKEKNFSDPLSIYYSVKGIGWASNDLSPPISAAYIYLVPCISAWCCLYISSFCLSFVCVLTLEFFKVWWKRDGCPPFEKQQIEKKLGQGGQKKRYAKLNLVILTCLQENSWRNLLG